MGNSRLILVNIKVFLVPFFGEWELLFTMWGFLFLLMVICIRARVIMFSLSYITGLSVINFVVLYLLFILSMVWLIMNNNFYWIMFGWDGLGVVSFLLIVYYINHESVNNGLFTLFQNRLGDLFFVLFILGVVNIGMWRALVLNWGIMFLILGACVKRAQFPFNAWLLSAMSAPTPISSLVHSSTLVVAGVFVLLQFQYCLIDSLIILKYIRILRLVISSFGLLNELDMKKLIAYSTMSHVSLMIYFLRFKLFKIVYFHLNIHAIFKSLIFICFGFVILASFHAQDKRLITLINLNPLIKMVYYFSALCLAGLPFLRAFFSKDFIIEKLTEFNFELSYVMFLIFFLRISVYYSLKLIALGGVAFPFSLTEKSYLGMWSLFFITVCIIIMINLFLTLVFRVTLEIFSFKVYIYLWVFMFFILGCYTNLNLKFGVYDKVKNVKELWSINFYRLDSFVYWEIFCLIEYIRVLSNVKFFLLINWWVVVLVIIIFYNKSLISVALKKLRFPLYFLKCFACIIFVNKVQNRILL